MIATDLRQASPDRASLLRAEVKGEVLLVLVELAKVLPLLLICDRQNTGNRLADGVATVVFVNNVLDERMGVRRTSW